MNLTKFTKIVLDIMFVGGVVVILTLPLSLKWYGKVSDGMLLDHIWQIVAVLSICGVFALLIIGELRKMFDTVLKDDCFVKSNVNSLKRMGAYSIVIAIFMGLRCILIYPTLSALSMVLVFVVASLFSNVLSQVFDKAVTYKLENDFTI